MKMVIRKNPYDEKLNAIGKKLADLFKQHSKAIDELHWYETTSISELVYKIDALNTDLHQINVLEGEVNRRKEINSDAMKILAPRIGTLFNPKNWFDSEQRTLRSQLKSLQKKEKSIIAELNRIRTDCADIKIKLETGETDRRHYETFNPEAQKRIIQDLSDRIKDCKSALEAILEKKNRLDAELLPLNKEIDELRSSIERTQNIITRARELDLQLKDAENSYERAMIHRRCEEEFGAGSPAVVVREHENKEKKLSRDLEKIEERAENIVFIMSLDIREIIIDGNNLCYEDGKFIRLSALKVLVPKLTNSYRVTIVFDHQICDMLRMPASRLMGDFHGARADVHIAGQGKKADDVILSLASKHETSFVLSGDKFVDYKNTAAVAQKRIIHPEIVRGDIIIAELGIHLSY